MEYKKLGNTGTLVSELCLGTMTFGGQTSESDARKIMDRYVEEGGYFLIQPMYIQVENQRKF
jgi:Predicted oxidoreductases (related to aryl-alcohol dehydrogenases)